MDDIRRMMKMMYRMAQAYTARAMEGSDLSPTQMQALRTISFHQNISQQELSSHMGIDKAAVARIIPVLEGKGYIVRVADPHDGRIKRLEATPLGQEVKHEILHNETSFYQRAFLGEAEQDMEVFAKVLGRAFERAAEMRKRGYKSSQTGEETP